MICKICERKCNGLVGLSSHITKSHTDVTIRNYYDSYIKKSDEGICLNCKGPVNFISMKGYSKYCGYKCSNSHKEKIEKMNHTNEERYGGTGFKSAMLREKNKQTMIQNLGVEYASQSPVVQKKSKITWLRTLGVDNPSKSENIKKQKEETTLKNLGVKYYLQSSEGKARYKQTCLAKYGFISYSKTVQFKRIVRRSMFKQIINSFLLDGKLPGTPNIGKNERICLNELQLYTNFKIRRNELINGYFPDGWIKELNILLEYDESFHYKNGKLSENDIQRQQDLTTYLNCTFIRIKEKDWFKDKDQIIQNFKSIVSNIEPITTTQGVLT